MSNPQSWNRFSYTQNNPISNNDPSGHCSIPIAVGPYGEINIPISDGACPWDQIEKPGADIVYSGKAELAQDVIARLFDGIPEWGSDVIRLGSSYTEDDSTCDFCGGQIPTVYMASKKGKSPKDIIPRDKHGEYDKLKEKHPDWMPSDDAELTYRTKKEAAAARKEVKGSGHHRIPLKFGGEPNPPEGLVQTGETRKDKNPIHTEITNFWNSVMRLLNKK